MNLKLKRMIDVVLFILLMFLMSYPFMESWQHEIIAMITLFIVILHEIVNRKWFRALSKGHYSITRKILTVINICLIIDMALAFVSGLSMSELVYIFNFIPASLARKIHMVSVHWSLILMALHFGMHFKAIVAPIRIRIKKQSETMQIIMMSILPYLIMGTGILCFIKNQIIDYLFALTDFAYFYEANIVQFIFEYLMIFISFASLMSFILNHFIGNKKNV